MSVHRGAAQPLACSAEDLPAVNEEQQRLAKLSATSMSLHDLFTYGAASTAKSKQRLINAQFLHREVPLRIAHRIEQLRALPHGLGREETTETVIGWYCGHLKRFMEMESPSSDADEEEFTNLLHQIQMQQTAVVQTLSLGVHAIRRRSSRKAWKAMRHTLDADMDAFFMARIGLLFLVEHHLASTEKREGWAGILHSHCNPMSIAEVAAEEAASICEYHLGVAPTITFHGASDIEFTYVPSHLRYMLFELLKNSCRAVVLAHGNDDDELPEIKVVVSRGAEDVTLKISDEGGGIPRSQVPLVTSYMHSTAKTPSSSEAGSASPLGADGLRALVSAGEHGSSAPPLAGFGVGIPLSRVYSRYFGGDLQLMSMEGFGTDAYLHLALLGERAENLSRRARASPAERNSEIFNRASSQNAQIGFALNQ